MSFLDVNIDEQCTAEFEKVKKNQQKFAIFKTTGEKLKIVPDIPENATDTAAMNLKPEDMSIYDYFTNVRLADGQVRYAVYTYDITIEGGYGKSKRDKCIFISWCPMGCKVKEKMIHASTKGSLKKFLGGFPKEIQAESRADLASSNIIECLNEMNNIKLAGTIIEFEGEAL